MLKTVLLKHTHQLVKISFDPWQIRGCHRRIKFGGQLFGRLEQLSEVGACHYGPVLPEIEINISNIS